MANSLNNSAPSGEQAQLPEESGDTKHISENRNMYYAPDAAPVPIFDPVTRAGRRARWALLITSAITLLCLLAAIVSEHFVKPWRGHQRGFRNVLAQVAASEGKEPPPFPQEIKQISSAGFDVSDRCTTCHLGYDNPKLAEFEEPFRSHPQWVFDIHPPEQFGCVICHGGQGLATTTEDAHGTVAHWENPLIAAGYYEAGCGSCHTHIKVPPQGMADHGKSLFERNDCFSCHVINGRGRGAGPDLSGIGIKRPRPDWPQLHLAMQEQATDPLWWESYGPIPDEEVTAINAYLDTLVQAPKLVDAKALVYQKGCLGCHRINGTGGDDGPDLSLTGKKNPNRLDFTHVEGERNLAQWHRAHLEDPALIVAGSQMPHVNLAEEEIKAVILYMLSLRGGDAPMNQWPPPRFEVERLGAREFATDGESLFNAFCNSCHGDKGQGVNFGIFNQRFPSISGSEFLAVASDRFMRQNLTNGRPGRKMPSWGTKDGGLRAPEIEALVDYLRAQEKAAPPAGAVFAASADEELGASVYEENCVICHGGKGEGGIGPALSNQEFLSTVDSQFIYQTLVNGREDTAMGNWRHLDERELASLIGHIEKWRKEKKVAVTALPGADSVSAGQQVFAVSCAPCHGERGEGKLAVNLVNSTLLEAASDGYIAAAVKFGRCVPPEGASESVVGPKVSNQELANAIAFIRQRAARIPMQAPGRSVIGNIANGESLFAESCAGCHGQRGRTGAAVELANSALLNAATDGYLQASIVRGRPTTGMPAFGSDGVSYRKLAADEVNDVVAFIRNFQSEQ